MNAYEERVFRERGWVVMDDSGCLSSDPECANGPRPSHTACLCSACEEREDEEKLCSVCGEPGCEWVNDICPNATGYRISR